MRVTIIIDDLSDGDIKVTEIREPGPGEGKSSETKATLTSDVLFLILGDMDEKRDINRDTAE